MNKLDITVILPVNKVEDSEKILLGEAVNSVFNQSSDSIVEKLLIVTTQKMFDSVFKNFLLETTPITDVNEYRGTTIEFLINDEDGANNYQNQVNKGVKACKTKFFMLLDFDDEFTPIHFKNVNDHIKNKQNVKMFLTLIADTTMDKKMFRYINEVNWAKDMTQDKHGYLSIQTLMNYNMIALNGAAIDVETFLELGGLKESMKLTYIQEFLLRFADSDGIGYTIPKIGYIRKNGRQGSYLDICYQTMSEAEVAFWFDLSKKEYVFTKDRKKLFIPSPTNNDSDINTSA